MLNQLIKLDKRDNSEAAERDTEISQYGNFNTEISQHASVKEVCMFSDHLLKHL